MAERTKLAFVKVDVFTSERYRGNPLAIVLIPPNLPSPLSQEQKQLIAREFNLSETAFIHEREESVVGDSPFVVDIFTPYAELPFAGHPAIGVGWYLLGRFPDRERVVLRTKAGCIPVTRTTGGRTIQLEVPVDFKSHGPHPSPTFKQDQTRLGAEDYTHGLEGPEEIVSIVKGMTFQLLELASTDALASLQPMADRIKAPDLVKEEWLARPFLGLYAFCVLDASSHVQRVRTRRFYGCMEDPATGSAASALGGYLALRKGEGTWNFKIEQGVEMGRHSKISVEVTIGKDMTVTRILLSGDAVEVMEGSVLV